MTEFTQEIKDQMLAELAEHLENDQIIQGFYWVLNNDWVWRGCTVGCLTQDPDGGHSKFPFLFGLPEWFAYAIDQLHESLPLEIAKEWPMQVIGATPVGVHLDSLEDGAWRFASRPIDRANQFIAELEAL